MNARRTRRRSGAVEKYTPLVQLVVGALIAVLVLPSALRPAAEVNQSAELSPDAPPDNDESAIVAALNKATSDVAGGGVATAERPDPDTDAVDPSELLPPVAPVARACPNGFGVPPRQVESVYSAPCAGPFAGDNGGATWKGVTSTEIRVGVRSTASRSSNEATNTTGDCERNGAVGEMDPASMSQSIYSWYVFEKYFNHNFQLYGRQLRFYCIEPEGNSNTDEVAAAVQADEEYHIFGTPYQLWPAACDEFARRRIISFCEQLPAADYAAHAPYQWGAQASGDDSARWTAEYWCKALVGRDAAFAGDPATQRRVRKFAVIALSDRGYEDNVAVLERELGQRCAVDLGVIWTTNFNPQGLSSAMVKARADGVTTIMPMLIWFDVLNAGNAAEAQGYFPEWWVSDFGMLNRNSVAQLVNQSQWAHAFGPSAQEPERPNALTECYRAFHSIDPNRDPVSLLCTALWRNLVLFVSGVQMAGPELTPTNFERGWFTLGMRHYNAPSWAVGGGFAPGVYTYPHDTTLVWWNPSAPDPNNPSRVGAYEYLYDARRFCSGHLPAVDSLRFIFKEGVTSAPDSDSYETSPPLRSCA